MSRFACRRCDWRPDPEAETPRTDLLEHRVDSGHPLCVVCALSLTEAELQACVSCVADFRADLVAVVQAYALLPAELGQAGAAPMDSGGGHREDETSLPGGVVLSLLGPGSEGTQWQGRERSRRLDGTPWRITPRLRHAGVVWSRDPAKQAEQAREVVWVEGDRNVNDPGLPPSVAFELSRWEDVLRADRREPAASEAATVAGAAAYLSAVAGWAGDYHPAFDELAEDVRKLRRTLEEVTSRSDRPEVGARCIAEGCGSRLRRRYGEETWRCPRRSCGATYDAHSYWLTVRDELEREARA